MLYERWKQVATRYHDEIALRNPAAGEQWSFDDLFVAGEKEQAGADPVIFPQGHSPQFILRVLAAWREQKVVCPLEPDQNGVNVPGNRLAELPSSIVHLKCTSATSGPSKLVAFTAEQLAADADNIVATMGLRPEWPNIAAISLAHSYGFSNLVLPLLLHGVPMIFASAPLPEIVRRAAGTAETVTLPAVPAMWRAWHEAGAIPSNVRLAISAGAPLPLKLEQEVFQSSGLKIHNFLGASECGGIAFDATDRPRGDDALGGTPMQNVAVATDADGCLVVRSRAVGETYWPERSDALGRGAFRTSDVAELTGGQVFLRGRLGDLINIAGRKVSPEAIERALRDHPGVRDCLVLGTPSRDAERTEIPVAVVVADASEPDLKRFLLERLPAWQVPRRWLFVDSLEANARGKTSRAEWRKKIYDLDGKS